MFKPVPPYTPEPVPKGAFRTGAIDCMLADPRTSFVSVFVLPSASGPSPLGDIPGYLDPVFGDVPPSKPGSLPPSAFTSEAPPLAVAESSANAGNATTRSGILKSLGNKGKKPKVSPSMNDNIEYN